MGEPAGGCNLGGAVVTGGMFNPAPDQTPNPSGASDHEPDFAVTHPLRPLTLAGAMTLIAYSGGVAAVSIVTSGHAPAPARAAWMITAGLFVAGWLVLVMTMWMRKPSPRETVHVWGWASRFIICTSQILIAWAIWGFLSYLPETGRMMLAGMFLTCSPAQLIAAPENVAANRFGILASNGSLALWFALDGADNAYAMGGFAFVIGLMLFVLAGYVPGTVAETVAARIAAEQAKADLERALEAVAEERDAKTRFIAAASHDLGQPLQAASLFFDQTLRAPDPAQRDRAADGVRKAFASADQLISHMLNHLRLEADAVDPHLTRVGLGPAMTRIAAQFAPAASAAGIGIRAMPTSRRIRLDRVLFERALGNLIGNAIAHSGATRIVMGARHIRGRSGGHIRIWVIDNGCGIARVDAGRIFDDYYRGSDSRAAAKSGFGLGLSSVRRIARLMDGNAGLDQRWLNGAAFFLEFPVATRGKEALT
ncbi:HAMP domain-containing sensor histidine kinase [Novosphingobium sp.]|uniref:sensor histidine kinase n=1 Tax=Novosphingobium sp. TaxID=1874826 RepID=UPI001EB18D86|nr:HAMP domain-containing sensor histidine kinase [Novosphingobium sp.]MBK9011903.1 HAMP domain-containing histidine kinase [Novosphingobium sp.]